MIEVVKFSLRTQKGTCINTKDVFKSLEKQLFLLYVNFSMLTALDLTACMHMHTCSSINHQFTQTIMH